MRTAASAAALMAVSLARGEVAGMNAGPHSIPEPGPRGKGKGHKQKARKAKGK